VSKGLLWVERFQKNPKEEQPEAAQHKTIKEKWLEVQKEGVDDSPEGIQSRLDHIDEVLKETEEFLGDKKQRVLPPGVK